MTKKGKRDFHREVKEADTEDTRMRLLFFALLRQHGRVRIKASDVAAIDPRDSVHMATDATTGDVLVTYDAAPSEEPGAPPKLGARLDS